MPIARSSIVGILAGALVLAGFVGFVVGLPEVVGDSTEASAEPAHPPLEELLPDELLDRGLVRIGEVRPEAADQVEEADDYSSTTLSEVFDAETAVARYADANVQTQMSLTITEADSAFFLQNGPPAPAELTIAAQGFSQDLVRIGDAVCAQMFQATQDGSDPTKGVPFQVQCQAEALGLTFNTYANGLTAEQSVDALHDAIAQAEALSEDDAE